MEGVLAGALFRLSTHLRGGGSQIRDDLLPRGTVLRALDHICAADQKCGHTADAHFARLTILTQDLITVRVALKQACHDVAVHANLARRSTNTA